MKLQHSQRGMTIWSMLLIAVLVVGFVLGGMRVVPMYLSNMSVNSSLQGLASDPESRAMTKTALRKRLMRRLEVDDMDDVIDSKDINVKRVNGGTEVMVKYEHRIPFVANLELVGVFEQSALVPSR